MIIILNFVLIPLLLIAPFFLSIWRFAKWIRLYPENNFYHYPEGVLDFAFYENKADPAKLDYPEILFMMFAPIAGCIYLPVFKNDIHPFALEHSTSLVAFILISFLSYWLSRFFKNQVSPLIYALLPAGMIIGCVLYLIMAVHFISSMTILGGMIFPYFAIPLFAPIPALLYNIRELIYHNDLFPQKMLAAEWYHPLSKSKFFRLLAMAPWASRPGYYLATAGFAVFIAISMTFFGQDPFSIIKAFTESRDFLLSGL